MVIIDTFYHLIEKDTGSISHYWKELQIIGFVTASITGFLSSIWFYMLLQGFSMNCILYPDIAFKKLKPEDELAKLLPKATTIDGVATIWRDDILCQYSICTWTMSFVAGAVLATFFIVSPKGGKGYSHSTFSQPWKMIFPMVLVSFLMCILTGVAVTTTAGGINSFCAAFENFTNTTVCSEEIDVYTLKFNDRKHFFNRSRKVVKGCGSITWIAWIYCLIILTTRICLAPDFQLQIVNIKSRKYPRGTPPVVRTQPSYTVLQHHRQLNVQLLQSVETRTQSTIVDESDINYV